MSTRSVPAAEVAALEADAHARDQDVFPIDFARCTTKRRALETIATALDFPTWFGMNWDALEDCLSDMDATNGVLVVISHLDAWRSIAADEVETFLDIMASASAAFEARSETFEVVIVV